MTAGTHRPECPQDFLCDCGLEDVLALLNPRQGDPGLWVVGHHDATGAIVTEQWDGESAACARMRELAGSGCESWCWPVEESAMTSAGGN